MDISLIYTKTLFTGASTKARILLRYYVTRVSSITTNVREDLDVIIHT
jgi:hypothetical protein